MKDPADNKIGNAGVIHLSKTSWKNLHKLYLSCI
jgi:hypothetical protein